MSYQMNKNKYLLDGERAHLEALIERSLSDPRCERDCLALLVGLYTGARAQEILNLNVSDLDLTERTVLIHGIKGSNDREIPIPHGLFVRLKAFVKERSGLIFDISYSRLNQIWQHYRPCAKTLHSLRHTFAISLYKKRGDIRLLQVALGHKNISNTMIYADYIYSQTELRRLIL